MDHAVCFRFMSLPKQVRNRIYQFVCCEAGAYIGPASKGEIQSSSVLVHTSLLIRSEYKTVLHAWAPVIKVYICDFDFSGLIALCGRVTEPWWEAFPEPLKPTRRTFHIHLRLTEQNISDENLERLRHWSEHFRNVVPSTCKTKYTLDDPLKRSGVPADQKGACVPAFSRKAQEIAKLLRPDYDKTLRGPLKQETGKLLDCLLGRHDGDDLFEHREPVLAWHEDCLSNKPSNMVLKMI